uniref:Putative glutamine amidotransferase like class 1 domain containing 3A-like1 n=1 Tax=Gallus gallus TaxID=9031 RepID=E1BQD1_CHICK
MGKRVAVVLAGCGVFDGSEIHEASAVLVHLSRGGAEVKIFAPNIEQRDVVNHLKGSPADEKRNVLVESARLARGNIQDLAELKVSEFDAVIFPGGFGVAKNLCSWAVDGKNCTVNEYVNSTLRAFHGAKKPIGLCCISPVLAAKIFPGCEVTVGQDKNVDGRFPDAETASAIAELGCKHICKDVSESHVDKANKIVTTCAFMCKAPLHEIFDGIGTMGKQVATVLDKLPPYRRCCISHPVRSKMSRKAFDGHILLVQQPGIGLQGWQSLWVVICIKGTYP